MRWDDEMRLKDAGQLDYEPGDHVATEAGPYFRVVVCRGADVWVRLCDDHGIGIGAPVKVDRRVLRMVGPRC